jgi:iron complex outermembrane receptor protein
MLFVPPRVSRATVAHVVLLTVAGIQPFPVRAQDRLSEVVVRDRSTGADLAGEGRPGISLAGPALDERRATTLGETLAREPGMASSGFGPNAGRPVVRGQDGDRIRLMHNGTGSVDASALSFDHATTIEPLVLDRIEVLRGPAALRFGSTAIGGVINGIDTRIPTAPITTPGGRAEVRAGGADAQRAAVGVLEGGSGAFALRADAFTRATSDLRIPGDARSMRRRMLDAIGAPNRMQPQDRLPNTWSLSEGGSLGGSAIWDRGHLGLAVGTLRSRYGTPAEEGVEIGLHKETVDLGGEWRDLNGPVHMLRLRVNHSDYEHQEKQRDSGSIDTTFRNRGSEARLEAVHAPLGVWKGLVGLQSSGSDFAAIGQESYVPRTRSRGNALFAVEETSRGPWRIVIGVRGEQTDVGSAGAGVDGPTRFGEARERRFAAVSTAATVERQLGGGLTATAVAAQAQRAPSYYELYADGPHAATGAYEIGEPLAAKERSRSFEAGLRWGGGDGERYAVTAYRTRFRNYLDLAPTGRLRTPLDEVVNAGSVDEVLPEFAYRQVPALFEGAEAQARWRLAQGPSGIVYVDGSLDFVRAQRSDTSEPLPRIPPLRATLALSWQRGPLTLRSSLTRASSQTRVAANELPTDGYTLLDAWATWRLRQAGGTAWELFLRGTNLTDAEVRNHASLLKDIAPSGGRSVLAGIRAIF